MARVELPSGGWVEYRENLTVQDRIAANSALSFRFEPGPDGTEVRTMTGGSDDRMRIALLGRIITAWSFPGVPPPSSNIADPADLIGSVLDLDDYEAVCDAIAPLFARVLRSGPKTAAKETPEGVPPVSGQ
jgi:hypothetical protein